MIQLRDFPDRIPPMMVMELRQALRGKMFVVPFISVHVAMLFALVADLAPNNRTGSAPFSLRSILLSIADPSGQTWFWFVAGILLLIVMPWAGLSGLKRETEAKNVELLLIANLSRWRIVFGKWLVLCALGALVAVTMLPYLLVRYFAGGMNVPATLYTAITLLLINATANAIAIGLSGYQSIIMQIILAVVCLVSAWISTAIITASTAYLFMMLTGTSELGVWLGGTIGIGCSAILFCSCGLQLGRARIRLFERAYDLPMSQTIVLYIVFMPVFVGIAAMMTLGFAAILGALLMIWVLAMTDRAENLRNPFQPQRTEDDVF